MRITDVEGAVHAQRMTLHRNSCQSFRIGKSASNGTVSYYVPGVQGRRAGRKKRETEKL